MTADQAPTNQQRATEMVRKIGSAISSQIAWHDDEWIPEFTAALDAAKKQGAIEALEEAANRWQWGEWANAPRYRDQVQERIAHGQFVTDWLRNRVKLVKGETDVASS